MKERLTITLDENVLKEIDILIERSDKLQNRSHAIQYLVEKSLNTQFPKRAVILCGGKGTRFRPITYEIPKQLLPVHGKPILEHIIALFKKYGITEIFLSVGYLKEKFKEHLGDGARLGVHLHYIEEAEPLGTAGWMYLAKHRLNDEPFFITNGDELKDVDLKAMFQTHQRNNAKATIALTSVENVSEYGVAELSGSKIVRFVEKPKAEEAPSKFINSGLYLVQPEVLDMVGKGPSMFEKDIFPKIAAEGKLFGHPFSGQWMDTGTIERYERALKSWKGLS